MWRNSASEHAHQTQVAKLPETCAPVALKLLMRNPILREWRVTHTELGLRPWSDKVILRWACCPGADTFEPSACLWDLPHLLLGRASHDLVWTSPFQVLQVLASICNVCPTHMHALSFCPCSQLTGPHPDFCIRHKLSVRGFQPGPSSLDK